MTSDPAISFALCADLKPTCIILHTQPWRTRPSAALGDPGPLHYSVALPAGSLSPRGGLNGTGSGTGSGAGGAGGDLGKTTSTACLEKGEWEARLGQGSGLRGSLAPNWKPLDQVDLTGTGSVNIAGW